MVLAFFSLKNYGKFYLQQYFTNGTTKYSKLLLTDNNFVVFISQNWLYNYSKHSFSFYFLNILLEITQIASYTAMLNSTERRYISIEVPVERKLSSLKVGFVGAFLEDILKTVPGQSHQISKNYFQIIK